MTAEPATTKRDGRDTIQEALAQPTLCAAFQLTAAAQPQRTALRSLDGETTITWGEYADRVRRLAGGLAALGVGPGDVVCMMVGNRPEFHVIDTAIIHLGGAACSMYLTNPASKLAPLVRNADARVIVTEAAYVQELTQVAEQVDCVEWIVIVDGEARGEGQITLAAVAELPRPAGFDFDASWRSVTPEMIVSLGHTSGTTGEPKGVEFSHRAMMFNLNSIDRLSPPSPEGRMISYLPLAHLGERYMSHYSSLVFGYELVSLGDGRQILSALKDVRPTRFFSVPRVYEKLAAAALDIVATDSSLQSAYDTRLASVRARGRADTDDEAEAGRCRSVLEPVRVAVGLDNAEYLGAGAASPPVGVLEILHALGLPALECYGLSETAMVLSNAPDDFKLGTVGRPMPGIEAALADDGELLVRGDALFTRYRHAPELTADAIDGEGWFHTGDVGAIDADGFYRIVDRKKELIVTATGKNVAPRQIENLITQESLVIDQVVAIGDARRYMTALVVLDCDVLSARGWPVDLAAAAQHPEVLEEVARAVERANEQLSQAERVRSWTVLPTEWKPGGDELTATAKLRRDVVTEKYAAEIETLYRESDD